MLNKNTTTNTIVPDSTIPASVTISFPILLFIIPFIVGVIYGFKKKERRFGRFINISFYGFLAVGGTILTTIIISVIWYIFRL